MTKDYTTALYRASVPVEELLEEHIDPERIIKFCKACPIYNKSYSCPPFPFDVTEYWKKYRNLDLLILEITYGDEIRNLSVEKQKELGILIIEKEKLNLLEKLYEVEKSLNGSRVLGAGTCTFCELEGGCAKPLGEPCRHPELMRYSIEALGGNLVTILDKYFDKSFEWTSDGSLPEKHHIVFGLLN